ncbi:copper-binding protein [Cupriavidus basilensis]|uniref:Copper-binding protein n=1 Tax=Cupriavidus basilensis TaxID=68895 RepID=A0A643FTG9_9BURK|nr:copper-binding protein [Cupriavidus basilensis]QOT81048.1 copper-binding protein [Cupriavidus basilensis]
MNPSKNLLALLPLLAAFAALPAQAATDACNALAPASAAQAEAVPMTDGEIRKVDAAAGKLTIKHGPIANLDMGAMTMIFRVQDPALLGQVKEGDHVSFSVIRANGALTVTTLVVQPPGK